MTDTRQHGPRDGYHAYLVRLWQDGSDTPWRALTRDAETGEEQRFATIEQLFLFLHGQTQRQGINGQRSPQSSRRAEQEGAGSHES